MRTILSIVGLAMLLAFGFLLNDANCREPGVYVIGSLCTRTSWETRRERVSGISSPDRNRVYSRHETASRAASPLRPSTIDQGQSMPIPEDATAYQSPRRDEYGAEDFRYDNSVPRAGSMRERIGQTRTLNYDGQAQSDEALRMLDQTVPSIGSDPVLRAGIRVGGAALDAGRAVDHVAGDKINAAASKVDQVLSNWRRP